MNMLLKLTLTISSLLLFLGTPAFGENLPDLTVVSVKVTPANPHSGDVVHFQAVVKNIGTASTPDGVVIGGIFLVNGRNIAYSDTEKHALAPGSTVTLTSSGGGSAGDGSWEIPEGSWKLKFTVNDTGRFREADMNNNSYENPDPLVVTTLPNSNLVIKRVFWKEGSIKAGATVPLFVEVANIGNTDTPAGELIQLSVKEDDKTSSATAPAIPAGRSVEVALTDPWIASAGVHKITATVTPASNAKSASGPSAKTLTVAVDEAVTAKTLPSDSFVDSIGVNIHVSYVDTTYGHFEQMKNRLLEMGVRYVRDGTKAGNHDSINKLAELGAAGIHYNLLLPPEDAVGIVKRLGSAVISVEAPNEPDASQREIFPEGSKKMYESLYNNIKNDPATKNLPVLDSALAQPKEETDKLGQETCDFGNIHSYPGTRLPDEGLDQDIAWANQISGGKPIMATETGYTTAINGISGHTGVSENAAAKLLPRLYFEDFNRGILRTFCYEFMDERPDRYQMNSEDSFGLIRFFNSPKPTFVAMKTLIQLLADPGAIVAPGSLSYTISGDISDLHHATLQKRDGRQYLILWLNALSYDQASKHDLVVAPQTVTLNFPQAYKKATMYMPSRWATDVQEMENVKTLTLSVPDELLVVELTPQDPAPAPTPVPGAQK